MTDDQGVPSGWAPPSGTGGRPDQPAAPSQPPSGPSPTPNAPPSPYAPPSPHGSPTPYAPPNPYATYQPVRRPGPKRPRAAWFVAPILIAVLSVGLFTAFLISHLDHIVAADSDEAIGSAGSGLSLHMAEGHRYYLFQPHSDVYENDPECSLQTPGGSRALTLDPPLADDDWTYDESRDWSMFGSFTSPVTTSGAEIHVSCANMNGEMLVRPDESTFATLGLGILALGGGLFLAVALVALLVVLRYRNSRPPPPPPGWGYGYGYGSAPAPWTTPWNG